MKNNANYSRLGWSSHNAIQAENWLVKLKKFASEGNFPVIQPIKELQDMVYADPVLHHTINQMFDEAYRLKKETPLDWEPEPVSFEEFLVLLNAIMHTAPEAYQTGSGENQEPAGMIGFPINALLNWCMDTTFGYNVFANSLINQQFKKILTFWTKFLTSEASRYVLVRDNADDNAIAWLSSHAQSEMVSVAMGAKGANTGNTPDSFPEFFQCDPSDKYYGYKSWDDFFTRLFRDEARPVSSPDDDNVIVNACESAPLCVAQNVPLSQSFWLKGQPYSLENMLNWDEFTPQFDGGTVYQAFLSALSYHRWHSPVNGTIVKAYVVNGSYYLPNLQEGFADIQDGPDPTAPNNSQQFLTAVATRAIIFIEADNPAIGLMCVMPVGMAEVSSCDITVKVGQQVKKGDQLGMFHFGGSTHCLIFRPGVNLEFNTYGMTPGLDAPDNIQVKTAIAVVNS